jgi:hypothetical protein
MVRLAIIIICLFGFTLGKSVHDLDVSPHRVFIGSTKKDLVAQLEVRCDRGKTVEDPHDMGETLPWFFYYIGILINREVECANVSQSEIMKCCPLLK